ncbi:uncharacterized protein KQ657_000065 [Scheffersomyces spartinae]|uniref:K Homology domain-containing protein n=1 Tax=Scheffersomyces spartinae TaxID=45513 RepID=A0A9P7VDP6_9ASCO|nr:uncharacterized protein KQ657_000065 [Scheffersomyces spartinae]KAG7196056.1 hypothetical protein KQ657_000065 [Scheffersomyces spartinae]
MSTPAEIIAARVNGLILDSEPVTTSYIDEDEFDDAESTVSSIYSTNRSTPAPSIADESAFPTLGGSSASGPATPVWGPSMKVSTPAVSQAPALSTSASSSRKGSPSPLFKSSTIQQAFSLNAENLVSLSSPELKKLLATIKAETNTKIDTNFSQQARIRSFVVSGKPDDVKQAKRLIVRNLTSPLTKQIYVPSKARAAIIGPGGKNLRPIIDSNSVRIDIDSEVVYQPELAEDSDDEDSCNLVAITIKGDVEGVKAAEASILAIVDGSTKNTIATIAVEEIVKPFAQELCKDVIAANPAIDISIPAFNSLFSNVAISGPRKPVYAAKKEIKRILSEYELKVVVEEVKIPQVKHKFLPIESILEEENVLIKLPTDGSMNVKFLGEKKKIALAKEKARQHTSQYKVEVLEMSKAHKGNLNHVKSVAALLKKKGIFDEIAKTNKVTVNAPDNADLSNDEILSVPIEIIFKNNEDEQTKATRRSIVHTVNKILPSSTLVVEDIDKFLIPRVPETIDEVAAANKVSYVVLGSRITLFADVEEQSNEQDQDDFVESEEPADGSAGLSVVNEALDSLRKFSKDLSTVEIAIPSESQLYFPPSTIDAIVGAVDSQSVKVTRKNNSVSVIGFKSDVATIQKLFAAAIADNKEHGDSFSTTIHIPSFVVPRVIGKSGANLNSIRSDYDVKIDVEGFDGAKADSNDQSAKSEIVITGIKANVEACKAKLQLLSKKLADETIVRLRIEQQFHRRLAGPKFSYVNRLQDKYNVKIRFPSESNGGGADAPKSKDEITIKGASKGVSKAEEELKDLYQYEKENGFKKTIQIPVKAIALVLGKGGSNIKDIADGTGVEFDFHRDDEAEAKLGYAEVELTGSRTALKEATDKINEIVSEQENLIEKTINVDPKHFRALIGTGGQTRREIIENAGGAHLSGPKFNRLINFPAEGSGSDEITVVGDKKIVDKVIEQITKIVEEREAVITEGIEIAKERHGLIIGPAGSVRHALENEFNVRIRVPQQASSSNIIDVTGLPERIEKLRAKLLELTKDEWNRVVEVPTKYHQLVSERGAILKKIETDFHVIVKHGNLTRTASKLNSAAPSSPPESAVGDNGTKFTIITEKEEQDQAENGEGSTIPWRLIGSEEDTSKAAEFIAERLARAQEATSKGFFYSSNPSVFSKIVGSGGSTINQIRAKSNCFIHVPRAKDKYNQFVFLTGSEAALEKAKSQIEAAIKNQ